MLLYVSVSFHQGNTLHACSVSFSSISHLLAAVYRCSVFFTRLHILRYTSQWTKIVWTVYLHCFKAPRIVAGANSKVFLVTFFYISSLLADLFIPSVQDIPWAKLVTYWNYYILLPSTAYEKLKQYICASRKLISNCNTLLSCILAMNTAVLCLVSVQQ